MAPLKIALVGVLGIGIAASLAFADHQPNHQGGGDPVAAPAGYAFMECDYVDGGGTPNTLKIDGAGDPNNNSLFISGGTDPGIDTATDSCPLAIEKLIAVGWRLQSVFPDNSTQDNANLFYHLVSP